MSHFLWYNTIYPVSSGTIQCSFALIHFEVLFYLIQYKNPFLWCTPIPFYSNIYTTRSILLDALHFFVDWSHTCYLWYSIWNCITPNEHVVSYMTNQTRLVWLSPLLDIAERSHESEGQIKSFCNIQLWRSAWLTTTLPGLVFIPWLAILLNKMRDRHMCYFFNSSHTTYAIDV